MKRNYNSKNKKKIKKKLVSVIVAGVLALVGFYVGIPSSTPIHENTEVFKVEKVVDGDTIKINYNGKLESVRLIGIDTPESVHADKSRNTQEGKEVSKYVKNLLEGKEVEIEWDVQQRDKYGRLLGYVYLGDEMVNEKLLQEGKAVLSTYPPNVKYVERFKAIVDSKKND